MLNDFDDEHSVSEAADISMMSGSFRHAHNRISSGIPFIESNYLEPSSKLMAAMAATSSKKTDIKNVSKTTTPLKNSPPQPEGLKVATKLLYDSNNSGNTPASGLRKPSLETNLL